MCRAGLSQVVDGVAQRLIQVIAQPRIRLHESRSDPLPRDPDLSCRERAEFRYGSSIDGHAQALAGLDATKDIRSVVPQLADRNLVGHVVETVAHVLHRLKPCGISSSRQSTCDSLLAWRSTSPPMS